jgi:hypothetical protein
VQQLGHFGLEGVGVFCHGFKGKRTEKNGFQVGRTRCKSSQISRKLLPQVHVYKS